MEPTIHNLIRAPEKGKETVFELANELDAEGNETGAKVLKIERRDLQPLPAEEADLSQSRARSHHFHAAEGFIGYVKKYGSKENAVLFADAKRRIVEASLNELDEHDREIVALEPMTHPRWEPFRRTLGKTMRLEDMVQLLRENRRAIEDGALIVGVMSQVTCATEVTLHKGEGRNALNGVLVKTKVSGGGTNSSPVALPESITIVTPILVDEDVQTIEVDLILSASKDGTEVFAQLSSADLKDAEITAFDGLIGKLRQECPDMLVTHGSLQERSWRRVGC